MLQHTAKHEIKEAEEYSGADRNDQHDDRVVDGLLTWRPAHMTELRSGIS